MHTHTNQTKPNLPSRLPNLNKPTKKNEKVFFFKARGERGTKVFFFLFFVSSLVEAPKKKRKEKKGEGRRKLKEQKDFFFFFAFTKNNRGGRLEPDLIAPELVHKVLFFLCDFFYEQRERERGKGEKIRLI